MADVLTMPWTLQQRDQLVNDNMGLVRSYARRFRKGKSDIEDVQQAGVLGLISAADAWVDGRVSAPERGFTIVAFNYIRSAVTRHVFGSYHSVRLPVNAQDLVRKFQWFSGSFEAKHGRRPSVEEAGKALGIPKKTRGILRRALKVMRAETKTWGEKFDLADTHSSERIEEIDDHDEACAVLGAMTDRQRQIVLEWMATDESLTLIASRFSLSQQGVSQILSRAFGRARKAAA